MNGNSAPDSSTFWSLVGAAGFVAVTAVIGYVLQKQESNNLVNEEPPKKDANSLDSLWQRVKTAKTLEEYTPIAEALLKSHPKTSKDRIDMLVFFAKGFHLRKGIKEADELCEEAFALLVSTKSENIKHFHLVLSSFLDIRPRDQLYPLISYYGHVIPILNRLLNAKPPTVTLKEAGDFIKLGFDFSMISGSWKLSQALYAVAKSQDFPQQKDFVQSVISHLHQQGKVEDAIKVLEDYAATLKPDDTTIEWIQQRKALCYFMSERYVDALEATKGFTVLDVSTQIMKFSLFLSLGQLEEAKEMKKLIRQTKLEEVAAKSEWLLRSHYLTCIKYEIKEEISLRYVSCPISEWKRLEGEHLNELARKRKLTNFWIKSEFKIFKNDTQTEKFTVEQQVTELPFDIKTEKKEIPLGIHQLKIKIYESKEDFDNDKILAIHRQFLFKVK